MLTKIKKFFKETAFSKEEKAYLKKLKKESASWVWMLFFYWLSVSSFAFLFSYENRLVLAFWMLFPFFLLLGFDALICGKSKLFKRKAFVLLRAVLVIIAGIHLLFANYVGIALSIAAFAFSFFRIERASASFSRWLAFKGFPEEKTKDSNSKKEN